VIGIAALLIFIGFHWMPKGGTFEWWFVAIGVVTIGLIINNAIIGMVKK